MDWIKQAEVCRQAGDLKAAERCLIRARARLDVEAAEQAVAEGRADQARTLLEGAVAADADCRPGWLALARLHEDSGRPVEAEAAWRNLSAAAYRAKELEQSDMAARRALTLFPSRLAGTGGGERPRLLVIHSSRRTPTYFMTPDCVYQRSSFSSAGFLDDNGAYELATLFLGLGEDHLVRRPAVVLNAIADADGEPEGLRQAAQFVDRLGVPVLNHPRRVAATTRDQVYATVKDIDGLVMGRTIRADCPDPANPRLDRVVREAGLEFPVLVRPIATQTGEGLFRLDSEAEAKAATLDERYRQMYVIQYIECGSDDGYWRKSRLFAVDGTIYPDHHVIATQWNSRIKFARPMMRQNRPMVDEEIDFLTNHEAWLGERRMASLRRLVDALGLDYLGIDCNLLPDGRLFIFEANPCMRRQHHEVDEGDTYLIEPMARVTAAFKAMLRDRLGLA